MKKTTWKKIVSFVLVAALVISVAHFGGTKVMAEEEAPFSTDFKEDKDANLVIGATLTSSETSAKDVQVAFNYNNTGKGNYSEGTPAEAAQTAEIILVIDTSNSMSDNDIRTAKDAAVDFAGLLSANEGKDVPLVKLAVLTFNGNTNGRQSVNVVSGLASSQEALVNTINTEYNKNGHGAFGRNNGTMTQDALKTAASTFSTSGVNNKIIVLMSDGKPNTGKDDNHDGDFDTDVEPTVTYANTLKTGITIMTISYGSANNDVLGRIATSSNYAFTAAAGATTDLKNAFKEAKEAVEGELISTTYAEDVKMTVTLVGENFLFEDGTSEKTYTPDANGQFPQPKLVVQKDADKLAKEYGIVNGKITVPAIAGVVLTYTFGGESRTLSFGDLKVDVAVTNWTVNYYVEVLTDNGFENVKTTEYPYTFFGDQPVVTEESAFAVLTKANYNKNYYCYDDKKVNEKENVIDVYFKLDPTNWSAVYYVDGVEKYFDKVVATTYCDDTFELKEEDAVAINELPDYENVDKNTYKIAISAPTEEEPYTWIVEYTKKDNKDWTVTYVVDGNTIKEATDTITKLEDETFDFDKEYTVKKVSDLGKYDEKEYKEAVITGSDPAWTVTYTKKGNKSWTVSYIVDGTPITAATDTITKLEDASFDFDKEYTVKKVSDLGEYVENEYKEAVITGSDPAWTVTYTKKGNKNWTVAYVVDGTPITAATDTITKLEDETFDFDKEYTVKKVSALGEYVEKEYKEAVITGSDPAWTVTYTKKGNKSWTVTYVVDGTPITGATDTITKLEDESFDFDKEYTVKKVSEVGEFAEKEFKPAEIATDGTTWTITYSKKANKSWTVKYVVDGKPVGDPDVITKLEDETFDFDTEYTVKKVSELGEFAENEYKEADIVKADNVWTVTYTKKGNKSWYVKYVIDGKPVGDTEVITKLEDETFDFDTEYSVKKVSELGEYVDTAYKAAVISNDGNTWTVSYDKIPVPTPIVVTPSPDPVPVIIYDPDPIPVVHEKAVPTPVVVVTPEPEPEPEEEIIPVPVIETPEGTPEEEEEIEEIEEVVEEEEEIEIETIIETPEGTPEELDVDLPLTPEGLPQTGTAPVAVFFGIGAACIILGGVMVIKVRRREEEM